MIKQDILENRVKFCYLSIGSNLGNRKKNIETSKYLLRKLKIFPIKTSSIYETLSWPNIKHPKYYNIVLKAHTRLNPINLFKNIKYIEKKLGRTKTKKNAPRTCDIDIIDFNGKIFDLEINKKKLIIPHPRLSRRNFVIIPLFEIEKSWFHPSLKKKIVDLLGNLGTVPIRAIKQI